MRLPLFAQVFALAIMTSPLVVTTVPTSARNLSWPDLGFPAMTPMPETFDAVTLGSQLNTETKSYPPRLVTDCDFGGQHRATRRAGDTRFLQKHLSLWNQLGHAAATITVMRLPLFAQTFRSSSKQLRFLLSKIVQNHASIHRIYWKLIAERAPSWGCFWKQVIQTIKNALKRCLRRSGLSYEELLTVLAEVEAIVNCRPLTKLCKDAEDAEALTPSHFLTGKRVVGFPASTRGSLPSSTAHELRRRKQTTSDDTPVLGKSKQVSSAPDTNAERKMGSQAAPTTSEETRPAPAMHAASQLQATRPETPASQANAASTPLNSASRHSLANKTHENEDLPSDLDNLNMELESASAKRRRDSDDGAQVDETQVKSEVQWKVVSGGKKRNAARQRSSSLKRDDGRSN
ncbi:hypothetical protein MRX96_043084 [Rhipicephalus microplus]